MIIIAIISLLFFIFFIVEFLLKTDSGYAKDKGVTLFTLATPGNPLRYITHRSAPPVSAFAYTRVCLLVCLLYFLFFQGTELMLGRTLTERAVLFSSFFVSCSFSFLGVN